ncbi:MAG: choice-of-anchor X domain-containing protein, partial [Anaerolineales bacterium]
MKVITVLIFLALVLGIFYQVAPVSAQDDPPEFSIQTFWARVTPSVFFCDAIGGMTIEVHVVGRKDVARVRIMDPRGDTFASAGSFYKYFSYLYDDGTNGDAVAGDNVFTRSGLRPYCPNENEQTKNGIGFGSWGYGTWDYYPFFELKDGTLQGSYYPIRIALVDPQYRGVFQVKDFGNGLSATAYAFFIEDPKNEVFSGYPISDIYCARPNAEAYRKLYSVLPDAFDMAMVTPGMQMLKDTGGFLENIPYALTVANDVRNIGMKIEDNSAQFGSAGRLRMVIYNSFGGLDVVDHEIGHMWGVQIGSKLGLTQADRTDFLDAYHWNVNSDTGGQMQLFYIGDSGFGHFVPNSDGSTWRFVDNISVNADQPYSPLELYVMGLIGPEEVPPIRIFTSPPDMTDSQRVTVAAYKTITIQDIIEAEGGERIPSVADSPKNFTLAYIVAQDIPYDEAAYAYHSLMAYHLTSKLPPETRASNGQPSQLRFFMPFYWATGGRATLETRLPVDLPDP